MGKEKCEVCTDNRFEIIRKAKKDLLESTNIHTSEDEMKVLDNFLFRCWQMDWLKMYEDNILKEQIKITQFEYDILMYMNKSFVFIRVPFLRNIKEKGHYKGLNDSNLTIKEILENCEIVPDDYFKEVK